MQGARYDKLIALRLSKLEHKKLLSDAQKLGVSLSEIVRFLCSIDVELLDEKTDPEQHRNAIKILLVDPGELKQLKRQVRAWGHHYNQAIHALNIIQSKRFLSQEETKKYLDLATEKLTEISAMKTGLDTFIEGLENETPGFISSKGKKQ